MTDVTAIASFEVASIAGCGYNPAMLFRQKPKARQADKPLMRPDQAVGMIAEYAAPLEQHGLWFYRYQTLCHCTVGGPVEDTRLRTLSAYAHRELGT